MHKLFIVNVYYRVSSCRITFALPAVRQGSLPWAQKEILIWRTAQGRLAPTHTAAIFIYPSLTGAHVSRDNSLLRIWSDTVSKRLPVTTPASLAVFDRWRHRQHPNKHPTCVTRGYAAESGSPTRPNAMRPRRRLRKSRRLKLPRPSWSNRRRSNGRNHVRHRRTECLDALL